MTQTESVEKQVPKHCFLLFVILKSRFLVEFYVGIFKDSKNVGNTLFANCVFHFCQRCVSKRPTRHRSHRGHFSGQQRSGPAQVDLRQRPVASDEEVPAANDTQGYQRPPTPLPRAPRVRICVPDGREGCLYFPCISARSNEWLCKHSNLCPL